jgi:hypothetical protein
MELFETPAKMREREFSRAVFVTVLLASCLVAAIAPSVAVEASPARGGFRAVLVVADDEQAAVHIPAAGGAVVAVEPSHGVVETLPDATIYYPNTGFLGRDGMKLYAGSVEIKVSLWIVPRVIPFAGRFDGAYQGAALWDNRSRTFLLCGVLPAGIYDLECELAPADGLPAGTFLPLAWPDRLGREIPMLYDPVTGRFLRLQRVGSGFAYGGPLEIHSLPGGWPIAGEFFGSGKLELAVVKESGELFLLAHKKWERWKPSDLAVPAGEGLVWPITLPRPGGDAIALVDSGIGSVHWMRLDPAGTDFGSAPSYVALPDFRRPLAWSMSGLSFVSADFPIFFLERSGQSFELRAGVYLPNHPTIIPVKFPDDPPGGG